MDQTLSILTAVLGGVYVLFVPGLVLSYAFFRRRSIDAIERVALSFALSIAVVPLVAFYLNLIGIKISRLSIVLEVAAIIGMSGGVVWLRWRPRLPRLRRSSPQALQPQPEGAAALPRRPSLDAVQRRPVRRGGSNGSS